MSEPYPKTVYPNELAALIQSIIDEPSIKGVNEKLVLMYAGCPAVMDRGRERKSDRHASCLNIGCPFANHEVEASHEVEEDCSQPDGCFLEGESFESKFLKDHSKKIKPNMFGEFIRTMIMYHAKWDIISARRKRTLSRPQGE